MANDARRNSFWMLLTLRPVQLFQALCTKHLSSIPLYALLLCPLQLLLTRLATFVQRATLLCVLPQCEYLPKHHQRYHAFPSSRLHHVLCHFLSNAKKIWLETGSRSFLREKETSVNVMAWTFFEFLMLAAIEATVGAPDLMTIAGQMRARFLALNPSQVKTRVQHRAQTSLKVLNDGQRHLELTVTCAKKSLVGCWMQELICLL